MRYLFNNWDRLKKDFKHKYILLFLDYDGTLAPIAETPDKAAIPKETKELLKELSEGSRCRLAIISGRSLSDIKRATGLKNVFYVGNHGLEIEGPKIEFAMQVMPRIKAIIRHINDDLAVRLSEIKGAFVEDKGLTISVHYRLVNDKDISLLYNIIKEITNPFVVRGKIKVNPGKRVYEIRPSLDWDKGRCVMWLLERKQFVKRDGKVLPIYIGDDATDEDAFRAIKNKGLTIFVGKPKKSHAHYYLKDYNEVQDFLERILKQYNGGINKSKGTI